MAVANCPACGAPVEFAIGSSAVVVCSHCRSIVARTDRGVEDLGKVAAIIDTGSSLQVGSTGKYHGVGFRITGRTQMRHQAGGVWDELYAAFDDGRWGWLGEAQGKYYVTFKMPPRNLPARDAIGIGGRLDGMVVSEIGTATLISAEGEIPWRVVPGDTYDYADLSGAQGHFATIDYSEDTPLLFKGQETTLRDLGVAIEPRRATRVAVEKLSCSKCGGPLNLVAPDQAQRIICPNCGAVHDVSEGNLKYLDAVSPRPKPLLTVGSRGKIGGDDYVIAGAMLRSVTFDEKYTWTEYLLFNPAKGFRWLVDSDHHWSFVEPIAAGDVAGAPPASRIAWGGKTYRIFQDTTATVERVVGEFYWRVAAGEEVRAVDYIAPPEGITAEYSGDTEVNYSHGTYVPVADVEKAFNVPGLPRPSTVGWLEPNPHGEHFGGLWVKLSLALIVLAIVIGIARSGSEVFNDLVYFNALEAAPPTTPQQAQWGSSDPRHVVFTQPFKLTGGRNVKIEGYSEVDNAWLYVSGDVINDQGLIVDQFDLPIEYYHGYDDGNWTEGDRTRDAYLAALPAGTYTMRLEGDWDTAKTTNPKVLVKVDQGSFRWLHFWLAFALLTAPPLFLGIRSGTFEGRRWSDSMFTPLGTAR